MLSPFARHLNSRALIAVGGPDWRGFLQGLLTQDVETLRPGELRFGALLTPQGRLLYDLFIVGGADGCLTRLRGRAPRRPGPAAEPLSPAGQGRGRAGRRRRCWRCGAGRRRSTAGRPIPGCRRWACAAMASAPPANAQRPESRRTKPCASALGAPGAATGRGPHLSDRGQFRPPERNRLQEGLLRRPGDHLADEAARCDQEPHDHSRL